MEIDEFKRRFGARVQMLRRQRGLTQEQLAEAIDKSTDTVSNIETGRLSTRIDTALRIAQALDQSVMELFDVGDICSDQPDHLAVLNEMRSIVLSLPPDVARKLMEINRKIMDIGGLGK